MRASIRNIVFAAAIAAGFAASPAAAQQQGASWFQRADRNDDGRVTWAEYQRAQSSWDQLRLDRSGRYDRNARTGSAAARYDQNRDGRVTRAEYNLSLRSAFNRYDRNDDGVVTRREAAGDVGRRNDDGRNDDRRNDGRRNNGSSG